MPRSTILVVEDFEPIRRLVCSVLEQRAEFQVVGQVADGLEAIQKAEELQPDLVLLDIRLPKLNGIGAARQIRKLVPEAKILFLSLDASPGTVQEALSTGASGYVVKSDAGKELLGAVEAVLQGGQFVSRRLGEWIFANAKDNRTPDIPIRAGGLTPTPHEGEILHFHEALFYSDEAEFLDRFADFIAAVLKAGDAVLVVATESHRNGLVSTLRTRGLDIASAIEQGHYIALDVAETLSLFMVNDMPDPVQFFKTVGDLIVRTAKAKGAHVRVAACGECAPVLWAQGNAPAAVRLEQLWDEIAKTYGVDILCGYRRVEFHGNDGLDVFQRICTEHTAVFSR
jgi:DNA-binding NarL/FixJ family response regulator